MKLHKLMKKAQDGDKVEILFYSEDGMTRTGHAYAVLDCKDLRLWNEDYSYAFRIEGLFTLGELLNADYKIIERQRYYLVLNKCYSSYLFERYLNYITHKDRATSLMLGSWEELRDTDFITYQTKFTKQEIQKLIDDFGTDILDFEMVEVEEIKDTY